MRSLSKVVLAIGLLVSGSVLAPAAEAVTVRLKWLHQAQFAGFYVAKDKGYYDAVGVDVSIQPGGSDFPAIQMVAGGSEQFGVTGADQILIARSKGVPVVAIAVIYRENPCCSRSRSRASPRPPSSPARTSASRSAGARN
jgi:NitT/TauT family transport system substrate-binding protein